RFGRRIRSGAKTLRPVQMLVAGRIGGHAIVHQVVANDVVVSEYLDEIFSVRQIVVFDQCVIAPTLNDNHSRARRPDIGGAVALDQQVRGFRASGAVLGADSAGAIDVVNIVVDDLHACAPADVD